MVLARLRTIHRKGNETGKSKLYLELTSQNRPLEENPKPDYARLHEIARHIIHSSETLAMAIETMTSMSNEQKVIFEEGSSVSEQSKRQSESTGRILRAQITHFKSLHLRSKALEERLRNEINLVSPPRFPRNHNLPRKGIQPSRPTPQPSLRQHRRISSG